MEVAPGPSVDDALSNRHSDILHQALMGGEAVGRNGLERFRALIEYLTVVADFEPQDLQPVVRQLGPAAEETAMTAAERLRRQGREEGREEGREQGAHQARAEMILRLLQLKFGELPEGITAKVEAGTETDFEHWTERVLLATRLDQVFDDAPPS